MRLKGSHGSDIEARLSNGNSLMVNYRPQKFLGLLAPTQYARVSRLSPAFRVRVWLRETNLLLGSGGRISPTKKAKLDSTDTSGTCLSKQKGSTIAKRVELGGLASIVAMCLGASPSNQSWH